MRGRLVGKKHVNNMADTDNNNNTEAFTTSKQLSNLDVFASKRYKEKLFVGGIQLPDPYSIPTNCWENKLSKWPCVLYPDIYNYLINYPGLYTQESLKAYKSLDGYNYFHSGHVQEVFYYEVSPDSSACLLKTKVTPSQRLRDKHHESWVCLDKKCGYVISAHCNCKVGLGEAWSQVVVLLFKVMSAALYGLNEESRTSMSCVWNQFYRKKVQAMPVELNFDNPKPMRVKKRHQRALFTANDDDFNEPEALHSLKHVCLSACVLTKEDSDTDSASEDEDMPPLLMRYHEVEHQSLSGQDLREKCQRFVRDFQVIPQQANNLEEMTRAQHDSLIWQRQRRGRITATSAHDVLSLKPSTSKHNVLKKIMKYTDSDLSRVDAIKFGRQFEATAINEYERKMQAGHNNFVVTSCGLFVDSTFPLFAATPDGLRSCSWHGQGFFKIKCCFKHRNADIADISDSTFYLDENKNLKRNHRYYTQVQFQMYVCGKSFCDFVIHTHKGIVIETIPYNSDFVIELISKCT